MLTIITYVILGVITVAHSIVLLDQKRLHEQHHVEPIESASPQCEMGDEHIEDGDLLSSKEFI